MSWSSVLAPIQAKPYYKKLMQEVDNAYKQDTIYPKKEALFKAFELTAYEALKIIILGQDPYHNENKAMGLAFSVPKDRKIPPSLKNIYKELEADLQIHPPTHGDLTYWAKQGVLLLNTTLTVQAHKPLSHKHLNWEQFTDDVMTMLNSYTKPLVFMLWGSHAQSKEKLITNPNHLILKASHPSPLSARHSFLGSRHFSKANDYLIANGRKPIDFQL